MEKINIAELLKDCPKGMELDCTIFSNVTFNYVAYDVIWIKYFDSKGHEYEVCLDCEGCLHLPALNSVTDKCVIFPKGKTTWEGFQRPFKDGDILSYQCAWLKNRSIYIYRNHPAMNTSYYVALSGDLNFMISSREGGALNGNNSTARLASKEEKEKLFQAIKDNGYKWNAETKTLEKLIVPKFKVGDRITNGKVSITIGYIDDNYYYEIDRNIANRLFIKNQDSWRLDKFDISTLKPFDKVLVAHKKGEWHIQFFVKYSPTSKFPFICIGGSVYQKCVPYEENKHLMGTTNDCDEYFKTWK